MWLQQKSSRPNSDCHASIDNASTPAGGDQPQVLAMMPIRTFSCQELRLRQRMLEHPEEFSTPPKVKLPDAPPAVIKRKRARPRGDTVGERVPPCPKFLPGTSTTATMHSSSTTSSYGRVVERVVQTDMQRSLRNAVQHCCTAL